MKCDEHLALQLTFTMVRYPLHYFLATNLSLAPLHHSENGGEGEDINVCWFGLDEAERMALDGRIGEDLTAPQILRLAHAERTS
jgi:hypothetical protein